MYGDLLGYLRKSRGIHDKYHLGQGSVSELEIYDLVLFAKQIAAGMVFLGSRGVSNLIIQPIRQQQNFKILLSLDFINEVFYCTDCKVCV